MANAELHGLFQVTDADLGMMTSNQIQVNGAPLALNHLPFRFKIGQDSYQLAPVTYLLSPLPPTPKKAKSSQRKRKTDPQNNKPYIKKPPNAFMLFMKEQRPIMKAQILNAGAVPKDSATVNKLLGQKWKSLTADEQKKYFDESERISQNHANMYPDWSYSENYGKNKKRVWSHHDTSLNYLISTSAPEVPVQAHAPCTCTLQGEPKADLVSAHSQEKTESAEAPLSSTSANIQHVGLDEDLISTFLKDLGALESTTSSHSSTNILDEEDLTFYLYKELEALEAAEVAEASSPSPSPLSSSTCSLYERPEEDLTFALLKELEAMEAAEASSASFSSSTSFSSSFTSCFSYGAE
ncbi:uncharacterized protein LOC144062478 [Vanacampus margaritifer]